MKLLLDQNLSAAAAEILRADGVDVLHTREVGLSTADDRDILAGAANTRESSSHSRCWTVVRFWRFPGYWISYWQWVMSLLVVDLSDRDINRLAHHPGRDRSGWR
jgi:Domain of unknown function (DUF5615)